MARLRIGAGTHRDSHPLDQGEGTMVPPSSVRPCRLGDARVRPPVPVAASLIRDFPVDRLVEVEQSWTPARIHLGQRLAAAGEDLESGHWDWRNKMWSTEQGRHRLVAVEVEGEVQGLMAITRSPRSSVLAPVNLLVYVDYIEAAPWNLRYSVQEARFLGVGTVLIGEAVRLSLELGYGGRAGLHALPQAERFYAERCKMVFTGRDEAYDGLAYFEFPADVATKWLSDTF